MFPLFLKISEPRLPGVDQAIKSAISTRQDQNIKEITSLQKKILAFLRKRDTFACLSTGYGKSLIFQVVVRVATEFQFWSKKIGCGQNTDWPQSMDYPDELPKWTTLKWTTPKKYYFERVLLKELLFIYLHFTRLLQSARPLAVILNNYTAQWTTAERKKRRLKSNRPCEELLFFCNCLILFMKPR